MVSGGVQLVGSFGHEAVTMESKVRVSPLNHDPELLSKDEYCHLSPFGILALSQSNVAMRQSFYHI